MLGLMGERPLLISGILDHAAVYHADTEIVSRTVEGPVHRYTYADAQRRSKQVANALRRFGIKPGDRVGTLAWNTYRHFELYYGISGIGAVCHTINPRLFDEQIVYIVNHAADRILFVDATFLPLVDRLRPQFPKDCKIVLLSQGDSVPPGLSTYEEMIGGESAEFDWSQFDERTASALCYTSGTTGRPKGVLYSHRSTVIHALGASLPHAIPITAADAVCPVVPLFHACGWGTPYTAPMSGAKLVFPGPRLDGPSLCDLFEAERVTLSLGVPTVWLGFMAHLETTGAKCSSLRGVLSGGSAIPPSLIAAFDDRGINMVQGWGMTEMSPLGTVSAPKAKHLGLDKAGKRAVTGTAGRPVFGVEMKIVDDEGRQLPHDGAAVGEILVRGPWIISGYFNDEEASRTAVTEDGWLRTGDVGSIDPDGFLRISDRRKDVIKSGGEWISTIDLENTAMSHAGVAEAAVIAVPHPRWGERPLLVIAPRPGKTPPTDELIGLLAERFPRWMLPDDVAVIAEMPHTATGKVMKTKLREMFAGHQLPERTIGR